MCELKINAYFTHLLYPNDFSQIESDTSFTIAIFTVKDVLSSNMNLKGQRLIAKGNFLPKKQEQLKVLFTLEGDYSQDNKGRMTLDCCSCVPATPTNKQEMIAFLSCGVLKGVGPKIAEKMYSEFGDQVLSILEKEPTKLEVVPGISKAKAKVIGDSYRERGMHVQEFAKQLKEWDISEEIAVKAYEVLGPKSGLLVKESLYHLVDRRVMTFTDVDNILRRQGLFETREPVRIEKGILHLLHENETGRLFGQNGNLYVGLNDLTKNACTLLGLDDDVETIYDALTDMDKKQIIHWDQYKNVIYRFKTFEAERKAAEKVARQLRKPSLTKEGLEKELELECFERHIELGDEQKAAVLMALQQPFSVITGFPGTGKTTIQQIILA